MTDWTSLPERQRQQQNAIWELVQTEVAYLRTLKVITDVSLFLFTTLTPIGWRERDYQSCCCGSFNFGRPRPPTLFLYRLTFVCFFKCRPTKFMFFFLLLWSFSYSWPAYATSKRPRSWTRSTRSDSSPICPKSMWQIGNFGLSTCSPCSRTLAMPGHRSIPLHFETDS